MKKPPKAVLKAKKILQKVKKVVEKVKKFSKLSPKEKRIYIVVVFTDGARTIAILTQSC